MALALVLFGLVLLTVAILVPGGTSAPAQAATNADVVTDAVAAPPLPGELVRTASERGRKIALMITKTDPMKWEIEGDHAHYRGSPALSFGYPGRQRWDGDNDFYSSSTSFHRYRPGLYMGGNDVDMLQLPILDDEKDVAVLFDAVKGVVKRRHEARQQKFKAQQKEAKRIAAAKLDAFMADVERRV